MFDQFNIVATKNNIGLDDQAREFETRIEFDSFDLIWHSILNQLKIQIPNFGYSFIDGEVKIWQEISPEYEFWDDSVRFNLNPKSILNTKDVVIYAMLLHLFELDFQLEELMVQWGKKDQLICPVLVSPNKRGISQNTDLVRYLTKRITDQQLNDLKQRFWILLNETYLNKLKSYMLFWQKKYETTIQLPIWCERLLTHQTADFKQKVQDFNFYK